MDRRETKVDIDGMSAQTALYFAAEQEPVGEEAFVGCGLDEEIHVGAVAVRPPGSKRRPGAEPHVVLATKVVAKGVAHGFEEFGRAGGQVVFRHQTLLVSSWDIGADPNGRCHDTAAVSRRLQPQPRSDRGKHTDAHIWPASRARQ